MWTLIFFPLIYTLKLHQRLRVSGKLSINESLTQFSLVTQSCLILCNPIWLQQAMLPCPSPTPGTYSNSCYCVSDAVQPFHPLSSPSPPTFTLSQHQGFSNESVLCIRWPKYWSSSFSISPSNEYSGLISFRLTGWLSLQSKGLSRVFSNTTVQKHQFFGTQLSL